MQSSLKKTPELPGLAGSILGTGLLYALLSIISKKASGEMVAGPVINPFPSKT